jgi:cytochrome c|tara:strand:+ start:369 stop:1097 length:729 start_codon:yes stop_codon:yes gene_type:complete
MMKIREIDMSNEKVFAAVAIVAGVMMAGGPAVADGDAEQGRKAFRQCAACHSIEKGAHRTGPSLANIWGRKAGTIDGFRRYSKALKGAGVVWDDKTLDQWLANPKSLIPGNRMVFSGMADGAERQDLIAFLKGISDGGAETAGGMQGGMMGQRLPNLKELGPNNQVKSVTHCADTYDVTTQNGETHQFWELNLRLKTDSSENGPPKGAPVLIPGGMRGDRANLVFSSPEEISAIIKEQCKNE